MPHKRAKASVRNARKKEVDLPAKDVPLSEDTPKSFSRLFKFKEIAIKRREEKNEKKTQGNDQTKTKLTLQPGEKLKDFSQRVEKVYQTEILSVHKETKGVSGRKKRNQLQRKQKVLDKLQKEKDIFGGRDFDDLKDNVKFGEVVDAPPVFKKLPKARGKQIQPVVKSTPKKETGYESEEDENMKLLKASHKRKIQSMSAAARKQLDIERDQVIESYRSKKAKRIAEMST
ncbi:hypothetical protein BDB01DRAFT_779579 [Pilobolus umbonatus]|nr:hypothetical protein BDB01DRAFT_779579 [Pilobolus umbonatus]